MFAFVLLSPDSVIFERAFRIHPRYHETFSLKGLPKGKVLTLKVANAPPQSFSVVIFDEKGFSHFRKSGDASLSMHTLEGDSTFTCFLNESGSLHFVIWNVSYEEVWINPTVVISLGEGRDTTECFPEYGD